MGTSSRTALVGHWEEVTTDLHGYIMIMNTIILPIHLLTRSFASLFIIYTYKVNIQEIKSQNRRIVYGMSLLLI